jgi:hypothetical protein
MPLLIPEAASTADSQGIVNDYITNCNYEFLGPVKVVDISI